MTALREVLGDPPGLVPAAVRKQVEQLLRRRSKAGRLPPILIVGETGVGKSQLARAIHEAGARTTRPFVEATCGGIPAQLLESELFGFERGAFMGARRAQAGLLQAAHRGTLFLFDIGLVPETLQAKLLTVLEDQMVRRLGGTRAEPVDVSLISVTDEYLNWGLGMRGLREDLLQRLAVVTIRLPPLRERGRAILTLARYYLARYCAEYGRSPKTLAEDARTALLAYPWPGNVPELYNLMERVALFSGEASRVTADMLSLPAPHHTR
jgi:transcriptional regulator with PAS, ATPase and Fis domain